MFLKNAIKKNRGFSLPELMLAVAILAFVLTGMLLLFINCIVINSASRYLTLVSTHAQFVMEEIKNSSSDFNSTRDNITNGYWDWDTAAINSHGLTGLNGESINTDQTALAADLMDVTVTVSWQDRAAINRSTTLETLISRP